MPRKLLKYAPPINRATFQVKHNWFPKCFYSYDNANFIPEPVACCSVNSAIIFDSPNYFTCIVDYGDGHMAQHSAGLVGSSYVMVFKSLIFDSYKAPGSHWRGDGETIVEPHHYEDDDESVMRTVTMTFSNPITSVSASTIILNAFPILESADLNHVNISENGHIPSIPYDSLSRVPNLKTLVLIATGTRIVGFPESFWDKTGLTTLELENVLDCSDIETSGIRNVANLTKLKTLNLTGCRIPKYLKEYNTLSNLTRLEWACGTKFDGDWSEYPSMDEVDEFHPNVSSIKVVSYRDSGRDKFPVLRRGINWNKASVFGCGSLGNLERRYPDWLYDVRNLKSLTRFNTASLSNISRMDSIVDEFYDFVTSWEYITMNSVALDGERNQFYGCSFRLTSSSYPNDDPRPSGTYQAPSGFVKGQSNGNPASPMEKIYALVENYNMVITVREEETTASTRALSSPKPVYKIAIRDGVAHIGSGDLLISNPEKVFHADTEEEVLSVLDELGGVSTNLWLSDTSSKKKRIWDPKWNSELKYRRA